MEEIARVLREYIEQEFISNKGEMELGDESRLIEAGIVDSLGIFLLIGFIEQRFGVKIQPEDVVLKNFETINTIREVIVGKLSGRSAR